MENMIDMKEARGRRPRTIGEIKDGYYKIIPLGEVVQTSKEGCLAIACDLFGVESNSAYVVIDRGKGEIWIEPRGDSIFNVDYRLRDLVELSKEESEQVHKRVMAARDEYS
ncbi:MAG: hypothetical protein KKD99_02710 [Proteobacteria bacterium]|nr:hypothetical protein [Pseudomonadota bacterium]MBU4447473.1 hypothetical protein [Pseudomonadota bacterium]